MKIDFMAMNEKILKSTATKPFPVDRSNLDKTSKSFGDFLKENVDHVADLQKESKDLTKGFMMGRVENIHDVTVAGEKAGLALKTLKQKLLIPLRKNLKPM